MRKGLIFLACVAIVAFGVDAYAGSSYTPTSLQATNTVTGPWTFSGPLVASGSATFEAVTNTAIITIDPDASSTNTDAFVFTYAAGSDLTRLANFNSEAIACIDTTPVTTPTNKFDLIVRINGTNYQISVHNQ